MVWEMFLGLTVGERKLEPMRLLDEKKAGRHRRAGEKKKIYSETTTGELLYARKRVFGGGEKKGEGGGDRKEGRGMSGEEYRPGRRWGRVPDKEGKDLRVPRAEGGSTSS